MTPWISSDDDIDVLARSLESREPSTERAEQVRTRVLAGAAVQRQLSRRSLVPIVMAGAAMAAAAAMVVWLARDPAPTHTIAAIGAARFERVQDEPDYIVRLDDGTIAVTVASLPAGERFRLVTSDAEVEVRGSSFDAAASHTELASVVVRDGKVEIRLHDRAPIVVAAGHSWTAVTTARRDPTATLPPVTGSPTAGATAIGSATTATEHATRSDASTTKHATRSAATGSAATAARTTPHTGSAATGSATTAAGTTTDTGSASTGTAASSPPPTATPATARPAVASLPGEAEFRAGWTALRANDVHRALPAFTAACTAAIHDALGEDACFWVGATAKRAGDPSARASLERFITQFPSSARVAEASALLGWLLYDAGDLDGAERRFHIAEHDRVPAVRDSAQRGLTAIARRR
jgi:TolA-binding protein